KAIHILESDPTLIKACDLDGANPLHVAASVLNELMVAWLIEHRASVRKADRNKFTPLDRAVLAVHRRDANQLKQFSAIAGFLVRRFAPMTPRAAVALGDADALRKFHREQPKTLTDGINWFGGSLLSVAVNHDRVDMLRMLLDLGLDPDE